MTDVKQRVRRGERRRTSADAPILVPVSGTAKFARRVAGTITRPQEVHDMQYLLLLTYRPEDNTQEGTPEFEAEMRRWGELNEEMRQAGVWLGASGLKSDAATTVRAPQGEVVVTDGPYAETKEVVFSFYIIDVEDLDAAIAWAAKTPAAKYGSIEIHPMDGLELT
jgi:hypothetical protein